MSVKDHTQHFEGLQESPTPASLRVPNTVSRGLGVGDRAFQGVVSESGKPVLDVELNIHQQISWMDNYLHRKWHHPSGFLRGHGHRDAYCDWTTGTAPTGMADDYASISQGPWASPSDPLVHADRTLINAVVLPRLEATVAGMPVVVEYTNTRTAGLNLVRLQPPRIYDGTSTTVKRTDFLFLEVWRALVAPSPRATGQVQVVDVADLTPGDVISIRGVALTAVAGAPATDEFQIGADEAITASNISTAINDPGGSFAAHVTARAVADTVLITAVQPGAGTALGLTGNHIALSLTLGTAGALVRSAPTLLGGDDRPNKPYTNQAAIYRHGNTLSPSQVWLTDESVDPLIGQESSQRVQVQYRIRATSHSEAINYKKHPDGFSSLISGGGPDEPAVFAQGNREIPVWAANSAGDTLSFPFVPADGTSTWLDTSAVAYGHIDDGLYIAGDGSEAAAQALGALDGFVYAIPLGFVHRHNNVSDALSGFRGWSPESNANGAPAYDHAGYTGPLGTVPAGVSDRPDGHFCDVISIDNILDLRRHVTPAGVDMAGELQYQIQSLLDGSLRTWSVDIADQQSMGGDSGDVSTRYLVCNEIGRTLAQGGSSPVSGEGTERGVLIRSYDHICRRFSAQPTIERVSVAFWPGDRNGTPVSPGTNNAGKYVSKAGGVTQTDKWYEGDVLHLNLSALNATTLGGLFDARPGAGTGGGGSGTGIPDQNFLQFAPSGTVITDILGAWHDDGHYTTATNQAVQISSIIGLGTPHVEVRLDANGTVVTGGLPISGPNPAHKMVGSAVTGAVPTLAADMGSPRRIFLEVEITYPSAVGTTHTPEHAVTPDGAFYTGTGSGGRGPGPQVENSHLQRPADFEALLEARYRAGFREIQTEYVANDSITHGSALSGTAIGTVSTEQLVSLDRRHIRFPRRVWSDSLATGLSVTDAAVTATRTVEIPESYLGASSRIIALASSTLLSGTGHTLCTVRYFAQDPIPNYGVNGGGWQIAYYYRANAPQTAGTKEGDIGSAGDGTLPTTLRVQPILATGGVWTGQRGAGSHIAGFPYTSPLDQIPINDGSSPIGSDQIAGLIGEWFFSASAEVHLEGFHADTGLLNLHSFVQQDIQEILTLGGTSNTHKPVKDAEFRAFYPFSDTDSYRPTIVAQPLAGATRHKVFTPFLARAIEDVPGVAGGLLFRKSELLLIVLSRFAQLDSDNSILFTDDDNRTLAAVYRTRNLLLTVGDRICPAT